MLKSCFDKNLIEAGCDEAGRGCLAGPVFAAAVVLPAKFRNKLMNDSKQLTRQEREKLRKVIEKSALSWAVASCDNHEIDKLNILWASVHAMHKALDQLNTPPQLILVDGNRFKPFKDIPHKTIIQGDATYMSIAAASILAKTYRDEWMEDLAAKFPEYGWMTNKGYPTEEHRKALLDFGPTPYHRMSFRLTPTEEQMSLFADESTEILLPAESTALSVNI